MQFRRYAPEQKNEQTDKHGHHNTSTPLPAADVKMDMLKNGPV